MVKPDQGRGRVGLRDGRNEAGEHREGLQGERSTLLHEGEWI